jgi:hypothetical protein
VFTSSYLQCGKYCVSGKVVLEVLTDLYILSRPGYEDEGLLCVCIYTYVHTMCMLVCMYVCMRA